jgi:hypothetical protein
LCVHKRRSASVRTTKSTFQIRFVLHNTVQNTLQVHSLTMSQLIYRSIMLLSWQHAAGSSFPTAAEGVRCMPKYLEEWRYQ